MADEVQSLKVQDGPLQNKNMKLTPETNRDGQIVLEPCKSFEFFPADTSEDGTSTGVHSPAADTPEDDTSIDDTLEDDTSIDDTL